MFLPVGHSVQLCGALFNVTLRNLGDVNQRPAWQTDIYQCKDDINAICELLAVKHDNLQLDWT